MGMSPRTLRPGKSGFSPKSISGLVAYWPLSEAAETSSVTALDASGSGLHLTSTGALSEPGRDGYGRLLSTSGSQWNPAPARLGRGSQNATPAWNANATGWSVAFWLKTDLAYNSTGTGSTAANIVFESTAGGNMQNVRLSGGTPALGFQSLSSRCYFSDTSFAGGILTGPLTDSVPQGQWTHMAFVANPATLTYTVYRNGTVLQSYSYAAGKVLADFSSGIPCTIQWPGTIDEIVVYSRALTAGEVGRLAGIPSKPASASALHPDCRSWISRVLAGGGTVSSTTADAVSQFCNAIDAAGIRSLLFRVNLFCGNSDGALNAVRTPLYRGPSLTGTQYGNTIDGNNLIVQGDYTETGTGGGLNAAAGAYLLTGFQPNAAGISAYDTHLAVYSRAQITTNVCALGGFGGGVPQSTWQVLPFGGTGTFSYRSGGASSSGIEAVSWSGANRSGFLMPVRTASGAAALYRNGANLGVTATTTNTNVWTATDVAGLYVFARNNSGTADQSGFTGKLQAYSVGRSMSASQALDYYNAMQAFQTALGRQI